MSILNNSLLLGAPAGGATGYSIPRSVRLNSADSAYFSRTPASAGNRKTWTWAGWVKRSNFADYFMIFSGGTVVSDAGELTLMFSNDDTFRVDGGATLFRKTTQVFRDPSSWYHFVVAFDTTQSTASNRIKIYVNGLEVTAFSTSADPSLNLNSGVNSATLHTIASQSRGTPYYLNGYLADIHFIDGQALTPSSFGEFDTNGIWQPKAFSGGSYGTNGFRLNFADNSAATAAALGKDTSGNGNNWTPNNLSVTAGAGNDSLVDSPTNGTASSGGDAGGVVVGNYATLNPLDSGSIALANGNLDATFSSGSAWNTSRATIWVSSGKWYWETTVGTVTSGQPVTVGVCQSSLATSSYIGGNSTSYGYYAGGKRNNGADTAYGASFTTGDVIGTALDLDAGTVTFYKNGTSQGQAFSGLSGTFAPALSLYVGQTSSATVLNFGARPFAYAAPAGFKSLNTANLPTPTILKGSDYFDTKLYTGNGSTQTISGLAFSPDFVWIKARGIAYYHRLNDIVRGTQKFLYSNVTDAEGTSTLNDRFTSFDATGFTLGSADNTSADGMNQSGLAYAAWCWDAGSSTVTNTAGSITSTVRASASSGFSVVTWTGNGSTAGDQTIGHGLSTSLGLLIVKARGSGSNDMGWGVSHSSVAAPNYLYLNLTDAAGNNGPAQGQPSVGTGSTFKILKGTTGTNNFNTNGVAYVAYCWTPVSGYSSMGSYVANANSDGPFVYTGFKPKFVLCKLTSAAGADWLIFDTARSPYNVIQANLRPNTSGAEESAYPRIDILSNGFKVRAGSGVEPNGTNGNTYIYAAFAENPFSIARAR